jgi:hypothetical protein
MEMMSQNRLEQLQNNQLSRLMDQVENFQFDQRVHRQLLRTLNKASSDDGHF